MNKQDFGVTLSLREGYRVEAEFDERGVPVLEMDEARPLGEGAGPNAARVLAAAIGDCLTASLAFCLRRARIEVSEMHTRVEGSLVRNAQGRLRIGEFRVRIDPGLSAEQRGRLMRCRELFEDFCVVTQSVRDGIDIRVEVEAAAEEANLETVGAWSS